jgi:recombinational DNA repair protein (RecF pathway)
MLSECSNCKTQVKDIYRSYKPNGQVCVKCYMITEGIDIFSVKT